MTPLVDQGVVAGNTYDKYGTRNPIARALMRGFLGAFRELVETSGARDVHEVGCGEGELSLTLHGMGCRVRGSDLSPMVIDEARRRAEASGADIPFEATSIYELQPGRDRAELVVCCEVLEHLDDPDRGLDVLASLASPHLLVSVPREPLWRALNMTRGKYLGALGNTPGHVNHWSTGAFLRFLRRRVEVVEVRRPWPWTMALCRTAGDGTADP